MNAVVSSARKFGSDLWVDRRFAPVPRALHLVLVGLVFLYSALNLTDAGAVKAVEGLFLLVGLFAFFRYPTGLRNSVPVWFMLASVILLTLSWALMTLDHPEWARSGPALEDYLDKFIFLFIALALAGEVRNVATYLAVVGVFVLLMPWLSGEGWSDLADGLAGQRIGFGINPIRTGMLFAAVMLGLLCFWRRIFSVPQFSLARFVLWAFLLVYAAVCLLMTQSRTAMVALIPALIFAAILVFVISGVSLKKKLSYAVFAVVLSGGVAGTAYTTGLLDTTVERFQSEAQVVNKLLEGNVDEMPKSAWGLRVQFWVAGAEWFAERPLAGWGYRAGHLVLEQENVVDEGGRSFGQVHNSYLEAGLRYGVGGIIIILGLFVWALAGSYRLWRSGQLPTDFFVFFWVFFCFFLGTNMFDGILFQDEGVLLFNVMMGATGTFIFASMVQYKVSIAAGESE
ncbi:O-antigen ligase family protein [Marinobacter sp.]|uniref:O-antigen ligase family protein n=1 Tax=Marinobacter sp. TaxID=50741 RepID=UPI00384F604C